MLSFDVFHHQLPDWYLSVSIPSLIFLNYCLDSSNFANFESCWPCVGWMLGVYCPVSSPEVHESDESDLLSQ